MKKDELIKLGLDEEVAGDIASVYDEVDLLKVEIEKLQQANKTQAETHVNEIKQLKIDNAIDSAITSAKGRNSKAIKVLLDLEKIEVTEDGNIKGLSEQLKEIQKTDSYLFDMSTTEIKFKGIAPGESVDLFEEGVEKLETLDADIRQSMGLN